MQNAGSFTELPTGTALKPKTITAPQVGSENLDDARAKELLRAIETCLASSETYIPEIEKLVQALTTRARFGSSLHNSGLPAYCSSLKSDQATLRALQAQLRKAEDARLRREVESLSKKVDSSLASLNHGAVRWAVLKRCRSLVAVRRTFQGSAKEDRKRQIMNQTGADSLSGREKHQLHRTLKEQSKAEVDVVEQGSTWIDIRWITKERLARQMTDAGWSWGEHVPGDDVDPEEWADVPLAKQLKRLVAAAKLNRHEYCIPRLILVLPNLVKAAPSDIDIFLAQLRRLDPDVRLTIKDANSDLFNPPTPSVTEAVANLLGNDLDGLTGIVNMDHTILVDLISDLTHSRLEPQSWQAPTTRAQIEEENQYHNGLMLATLLPLLAGRQLICTREAAEHFHAMLTTVGTETERQRGRLLVPLLEAESGLANAVLRQRFEALSIHQIPASVQIPIKILPEDQRWDLNTVQHAVTKERLPIIALDIALRGQLKSSKLSIYMYGWASGNVTLTSNKEIRGQFRTLVENGRTSETDRGPTIWCVDVTRNLLAKSANPPKGWTYHDKDSP